MVEDELGPLDGTEGKRDRPEDVRRVARLDHREPAAMRRALSASQAVARNEYAYSATKLSLLPPGA